LPDRDESQILPKLSHLTVIFHACLFLAGATAFSGCATTNPLDTAADIARGAELSPALIQTDTFTLTSFHRLTRASENLVVYLEGDGYAWVSRRSPSANPTPHNPVALRLAALDPSANVAYIARPCQYTDLELDRFCERAYWTDRRYAEEVVAALDQAIDQLVDQVNAPAVHLVGFSGGGGLVVLLAARRSDVASLRTVAGNSLPSNSAGAGEKS